MAQEDRRDYLAIPKGRGYAHANQLYNRGKTEGQTKYLKCSKVWCDGSAKMSATCSSWGHVHICFISECLSVDGKVVLDGIKQLQ